MKNLRVTSSILGAYYNLTVNRFYQGAQLERIMNLIAMASDQRDMSRELIDVVNKINDVNYPTDSICKNSLMLSGITKDLSELEIIALRTLSRALVSNQSNQYLTYHAWLKDLSRPKNEIEKGIFAYAQGQLENAIELLKRASTQNALIPIDESIAIISYEAEKYEDALKYATKAQQFDMDVEISHSVLKEIARFSRSNLEKERAEEILNSIKLTKSTKIGF